MSDRLVDPKSISLEQRQHQLTFRALAAGVLIGTLICAANSFFALQTGWVTMASLQAALLGFGFHRGLAKCLGCSRGFGPLENVVLQTTSVAAATIPLAAGFAGILPAFELMRQGGMSPAPPDLSLLELFLWSLSLSLFGVFMAVPLRWDAIVVEKLRFPSGTATAELIAVLHNLKTPSAGAVEAEHAGTMSAEGAGDTEAESALWSQRWRMLWGSMVFAALVTVLMEFVPIVRTLPFLAFIPMATSFGWTITPSLSYVGQGMIMGLRTTLSMLAGSVVGWAVLGPLARSVGWAPGSLSNSHTGAKSWVVWISLALMLGDAGVVLGQTCWRMLPSLRAKCARQRERQSSETVPLAQVSDTTSPGESSLEEPVDASAIELVKTDVFAAASLDPTTPSVTEEDEDLVPRKCWVTGMLLSTVFCTLCLTLMFSSPFYEPLIGIILSAVVALAASRALGETDLNPVSGVGKISQLIFALVAPGNVTSNLVAGALAEAGAQQAGDLLQDLKTGHLLGASVYAQFISQLVGSFVGIFVSIGAYKLLTTAYPIGGVELPVPTARVWLDMAQFASGQGLPSSVVPFVVLFFLLAVVMSSVHSMAKSPSMVEWFQRHRISIVSVAAWVPSAMGMGIGMYIAPNWVLPRVVGSIVQHLWKGRSENSHDRFMLLVASGFVLGEGLQSLLNAGLRTGGAGPWTCSGCGGEVQCSGCR
jgi:OPT family oligopeptide transporter